jgi:hypothetical protein
MDPTALPENCPPQDANALPLKVFRLLSTNQIIDGDFRSLIEEGRKRGNATDDQFCMMHGLSVFATQSDAQHHIELFGSKPFVASADLAVTDGEAKHTASQKFPSHVTWWPDPGLDRKSKFGLI